MTVTAASRHHHGLERSTVTMKTTKVLIPLKASRPVPKCLTLKRMQGQMQYVYDSSRINRRTKRTVPGTGVPCGALSCSEEDDLKSFLEVVERMDDSLAILLRNTFFASPSRIFRHAVAGMTFTVGEPPRLHFHSEKDGILLETEDFITQERLNGIVSTFSWDSGELSQVSLIHVRPLLSLDTMYAFLLQAPMDSNTDVVYLVIDHTIFPGTLHRLTRHSRGHAAANSLTLRLGRQLPDQECRRVAGDLCHRLGEHENLIITGPSGSGKTTFLRAMMNTLMGEFHKRKVGVVDEVYMH